MRRSWLAIGLICFSAAALAREATPASKDWTCVPTADGKAWDCGYGRNKPEQRYLATPAPAPSGPSSQGAPLGFADPGKAGPIGIAPVPASPPRPVPAPTTVAPRAPAPATAVPQVVRTAPAAVQPPKAVPAAKPAAVVATPAPRPAAATTSGRGPSAAYTIQIIGLSRDGGIDTVAARLRSSGLTLFRLTTDRNGAPWFVLTAGEFANATDARAAIAKLPADLIQAGAFPRQTSTLTGRWR